MTDQPYWWHDEERWHSMRAVEARRRSEHDRPGWAEDIPTRAEAERDDETGDPDEH